MPESKATQNFLEYLEILTKVESQKKDNIEKPNSTKYHYQKGLIDGLKQAQELMIAVIEEIKKGD